MSPVVATLVIIALVAILALMYLMNHRLHRLELDVEIERHWRISQRDRIEDLETEQARTKKEAASLGQRGEVARRAAVMQQEIDALKIAVYDLNQMHVLHEERQ